MSMNDGRGAAGAAYDALVDEIDHELNPSDEDCWHCGGEGYIANCWEEFACVDPEGGCEDCMSRCPECALHERNRLKAIREAVIKANNVDLAIAWLKSIGRWRADITREHVQSELDAANAKLAPEPVRADAEYVAPQG